MPEKIHPATSATKLSSRKVSERAIALALVLVYAETHTNRFSLAEDAYDKDAKFIDDVAERLGVTNDASFYSKLRKVTRRLVRFEVMTAQMQSTQAYYIGEPTHRMVYRLRDGKAELLRKGATAHTMSPEGEASFLLRHAYPAPDND